MSRDQEAFIQARRDQASGPYIDVVLDHRSVFHNAPLTPISNFEQICQELGVIDFRLHQQELPPLKNCPPF